MDKINQEKKLKGRKCVLHLHVPFAPRVLLTSVLHLFFRVGSYRLLLRGQLDAAHLTVGLARVHLLAGLGDGAQDFLVGKRRVGDDGGGLALEGDFVALDAWGKGGLAEEEKRRVGTARKPWASALTFKALEHAVDSAGAAAARHADVELVGVVRHCEEGSWKKLVGG